MMLRCIEIVDAITITINYYYYYNRQDAGQAKKVRDVYCFFDPPVHFVTFSNDHLSLIPIYDMVKSDSVVCDS